MALTDSQAEPGALRLTPAAGTIASARTMAACHGFRLWGSPDGDAPGEGDAQ